jgi:zinc protease
MRRRMMRTRVIRTRVLGRIARGLALAATIGSVCMSGGGLTRGQAAVQTPAPAARAETAVVMKGRAPVSAELVRVRLPRPRTFDLPNGLHVMVLEDHRVPQVSFSLVIPGAGGYFDPPDRSGLAAFTAAMITEGSKTRTSGAIAQELEVLSASLEVTAASASPDATITGACLAEDFATVIGLVADVLVNPAFPEHELQRYKQRARASFVQQRSSAAFLARELFARLVNGNHPAARTSPAVEALDATTPAALSVFHRERYVPDRAVLAIAGDVSTAAVRTLLTTAMGQWRRAGRALLAVSDPAAREGGGVHLVARPHSVQTSLMVGAPAISRTDPDFYALQVMNQVIGAGPTGRLFVHLREEKGYTYGAFSTLTSGSYRGWWSASTDVRSEVTGPALRDLLAEITRLRDERVPDEELRRHERAMVASFALSLESPRQLLGYILTQRTYRLPADYWDTYPSRIMAITSADVQRVARTYLAPAFLQIVAVGDPPRIRNGLSDFGSVETYNTDGRRQQ